MKIRYPLVATAGALMIAGVLQGFIDRPAAKSEDSVLSESVDVPAPVQTTETSTAITPPTKALSALQTTSLRDVDIPQSLTLDSNGHLIANEGLRTLMEFFLSLSGELEADQIRALFLTAAQQQCGQSCTDDAADFFDRYNTYLNAMNQQQATFQDQDDLRARLQMVAALRREWLGTELASALFDYEESYDAYRVSQWEIANNPDLSAAEKQRQLDLLHNTAPPGLHEREQDNDRLQSARLIQQQFKDDPSALYAARMEAVGQEATDRLQQLDQQRALWDQRYQQYRHELTMLQSVAISDDDRARQIEQLRLRHFNHQESLRVAALDRISETVQ